MPQNRIDDAKARAETPEAKLSLWSILHERISDHLSHPRRRAGS